MKRLVVLLCALLFALASGAGCESDSPLRPAWDDFNGKNMEMHGMNGGAVPPNKSP